MELNHFRLKPYIHSLIINYISTSWRLQDIQPVYHWAHFEQHHNTKFLSKGVILKGVKINSSCTFLVFLGMWNIPISESSRAHKSKTSNQLWSTQPCHQALTLKISACEVPGSHCVDSAPAHACCHQHTKAVKKSSFSFHISPCSFRLSNIVCCHPLRNLFFFQSDNVIPFTSKIQIYHLKVISAKLFARIRKRIYQEIGPGKQHWPVALGQPKVTRLM